VRLPPNYRNSQLVKLTILVPLLGCIILFNEELVKYLELTSSYFRDVVFSNQPEGSRVPCLLLPDGRWDLWKSDKRIKVIPLILKEGR